MLKKILKVYDSIIKGILIAIVAAFVVIIFTQVICRYVFNHSLSWSEELARVLFTQMIFLAAPIFVLEKRGISVDILLQFIPKKAKRYLFVVIDVLSFVFFAFLAFSGYGFAMKNMNQTTTALSLNYGRIYMIIPVSAVCMMINVVRAGVDNFFHTYAPEKEDKS